jgi:hypothetical protein
MKLGRTLKINIIVESKATIKEVDNICINGKNSQARTWKRILEYLRIGRKKEKENKIRETGFKNPRETRSQV